MMPGHADNLLQLIIMKLKENTIILCLHKLVLVF
jgi:hypothetical protein